MRERERERDGERVNQAEQKVKTKKICVRQTTKNFFSRKRKKKKMEIRNKKENENRDGLMD